MYWSQRETGYTYQPQVFAEVGCTGLRERQATHQTEVFAVVGCNGLSERDGDPPNRSICCGGMYWSQRETGDLPDRSICCRVGKNPGFFKKTQPSGFFWVFLGFLGFFGFFWVFWPRREGFSVFFSFTNTFRCIQTINYNHSY
jgi:hypothetical protein